MHPSHAGTAGLSAVRPERLRVRCPHFGSYDVQRALAEAHSVAVATYLFTLSTSSVRLVPDGRAKFEIACKRCAMRLMVDRIRVAEAAAMTDHLCEHHPELGVSRAAALGDVFEHYRVRPTQR